MPFTASENTLLSCRPDVPTLRGQSRKLRTKGSCCCPGESLQPQKKTNAGDIWDLPLSLSLPCFLPRPLLGITRHMALSAACPGLSQGSPPSSASYRYRTQCSLASLLELGSDSLNKTITVKVCPYSWISRQTVRAHRFPTAPHLDPPHSSHCSQTPLLEHGQQCINSAE